MSYDQRGTASKAKLTVVGLDCIDGVDRNLQQALTPRTQQEVDDLQFAQHISWIAFHRIAQGVFQPVAHIRISQNPLYQVFCLLKSRFHIHLTIQFSFPVSHRFHELQLAHIPGSAALLHW